LRTADAVVDEAASASAELFEINDTAALMRTASGTTVVEPVAVTDMYRGSAAFAGTASAVPPIKAIAMDTTATIRRVLVFMG
jgi:hypothetical protein